MYAIASHSPATGQPKRYAAGKFTVEVRPMPLGNARVEVTFAMSSQLVDGLDRSFTSPRLADTVGRILAKALAAASDMPWSVDQATDFARQAVCDFCDNQLEWLLADGSTRNTDAAAYLQTLKGWYATAETRARVDDTVRRLNAELDRRARLAGLS